MTIFGRTISLNMLVLLLLVVIAFGSSAGSLIVDSTDRSAEWWSGWLQNFSTEIIGAIATFALFELLVGGRKEKEKEDQAIKDLKARLIREAGSKDNATALNAVREIKDHGWLKGNSSILQGIGLRGANLKGADLGVANLKRADLRWADLNGANLVGANLESTDLLRANLEHANLRFANLKDIDLRSANLEGANLWSANLWSVSLEGAYLISANMKGADLGESNLDNACIVGTQFNKMTTLPNGEKWTPETNMIEFGCFVDMAKYIEWRESQEKQFFF